MNELFDRLILFNRYMEYHSVKEFYLPELFINFYNNEYARNINIGFRFDQKIILKYRYEYFFDKIIYYTNLNNICNMAINKTEFLKQFDQIFSNGREIELELLINEKLIEIV